MKRRASQGSMVNEPIIARVRFSEDVAPLLETFSALYEGNPEVKSYFDELYPIRLAEAEARYAAEKRRERGFETEEEEQAAIRREKYRVALEEMESGVRTLVEMGVPKTTIAQFFHEMIDAS